MTPTEIEQQAYEIAQQAYGVARPWLLAQAAGVAGQAKDKGVELGGRLFGWLKEKLAGKPVAAAAAEQLKAKPDDADYQAEFCSALATALKKDGPLLAVLRAALADPDKHFPAGAAAGATQSNAVTGDSNKVVSQQGQNHTATIS
jgi:hypothetical protein